jgi:hypothetical protein
MRRGERVSDLSGDLQRLVDRQGTRRDPIGQRRPFDQLHDEGRHSRRIFEAVDVRDVRMVRRSKRLGFALEAGQPLGIMHERIG